MEWVIPAVLVLLMGWGALIRARLRRMRHEAVSAWPALEALLRRRHGLITPLAQVFQSLPQRAQKPIQAMVKARNAAALADLSPVAAGKREQALSVTIDGVLALAEGRPELSGDARLHQIVASLNALDEAIAAAQDRFNRIAHDYNLACAAGPAVFVAKLLNFRKIEYFGLDGEESEPSAQVEREHAPQRHEPMI
jgi:hypothetical protein